MLAAAAAIAAVPARADGGAWTVAVQSDRHVDALPLRHLGDDEAWRHLSVRPGRNLGYLFDELRLSRTAADSASGLAWSLVARQRAVAVASEGALDLARQAASSADPAGDRSWRVDLDYLGFAGVGLEVGRQVDLGAGWQVELALQGLSLQRLTSHRIHGQAAYRAADALYSADLRSDEADSRMTFPFQQSGAARGWAVLLHGGLSWQSDDWRFGLRWRDAGWLRWRGLPQQEATLSTDLRSVDADGFVIYRPLVEGRNRQTRYRRTLAPLTAAEMAWRAGAYGQLRAGVTWLPGWGALPRIGWSQGVAADTGVSIDWQVRERRAEAALSHGAWQVRLGSDGRSASRSMSFGLSWRITGP